jgi:hypothetical protein
MPVAVRAVPTIVLTITSTARPWYVALPADAAGTLWHVWDLSDLRSGPVGVGTKTFARTLAVAANGAARRLN